MRLYLVRHGEAVGNSRNVIQGWADFPLTERGLAQSWSTAWALAAYGPCFVYSSTLSRARETAEILANLTRAPVEISDDLREVNCGQAEGLEWGEFAGRWPDLARSFLENDLTSPWPGGESTRQMLDRAWPAMSGIVVRHRQSEDAVVVVSHGGPLVWTISLLRGERNEKWPPYRLDNCGITEFRIDTEGLATLVRINDCSHLVE